MNEHEPGTNPLPPQWPWLFRAFSKYARKYAAKHLHAVRVSKAAPAPMAWDGPAMMVMNHPSWWDAIIGFVLVNYWPGRLNYGPMDKAALKQYRFLERVGIFGIEADTLTGAHDFLRVTTELFRHDNSTLWITAQGSFKDPRERPLKLRNGVGHAANLMNRGVIIPIALEYPFWADRTPEALVGFGKPIDVANMPKMNARNWTQCIADELQLAQDSLAAESMTRDPDRFETIVAGKAGVGGMYDLGRRFRAWMTGKRFRAEHSRA